MFNVCSILLLLLLLSLSSLSFVRVVFSNIPREKRRKKILAVSASWPKPLYFHSYSNPFIKKKTHRILRKKQKRHLSFTFKNKKNTPNTQKEKHTKTKTPCTCKLRPKKTLYRLEIKKITTNTAKSPIFPHFFLSVKRLTAPKQLLSKASTSTFSSFHLRRGAWVKISGVTS